MIATATPTQIALHEARKARMARLFPGRAVTRQKPKPAPVVVCEPRKTNAQKPPIEHDAHMDACMVWKAWIGAPMSPKQYFIAACWLAGYSPEMIRSASRNRALVAARRAIIRSLAQRFPKMSSNAMEPIVNRDHTTILYCMGQTERGNARTGGSVRKRGTFKGGLPPEMKTAIIKRRIVGMSFKAIGMDLGIAASTAKKAWDVYRKQDLRSKGKGTISEQRAIKDARWAA